MKADLTITEQVRIPHSAYSNAYKRLEQALAFALAGAEPDNTSIVGDSGTGKTTVQKAFASAHRPIREAERLYTPVLRVTTPSTPTVKGLAAILLDALGDPNPWKGSESEMSAKLRAQMKGAGTRVLLLDEFQHFFDSGKQKVMHSVADWLKIIIEQARVTLIVSGLPSCLAVIQQNEQLARRFSSPLRLERFKWQVESSREEFTAILDSYHTELSKRYEIPYFGNEDFAFRWLIASGGLIGLLSKTLRMAEQEAMSSNRRVITLDDLDRAHVATVWSSGSTSELIRPFTRDFNANPTSALLDYAAGICSQPLQARAQPSRVKRQKPQTLASVLTAV